MNRKYFIIINVVFAIALPAFIISKAAGVEWQVGFSWEPQIMDYGYAFVIANLIILIAAGVILIMIGAALLKRHKENQKESPLLLGMFNIVIGGGFIFDGIRKHTSFASDSFRNGIEGIVFIALSWALIFFYLFLQDIFSGDFSWKRHSKSHVFYIAVIATSLVFFHGMHPYVDLELTTIIGFVLQLLVIIPLGAWQLRASYKLAGKTQDKASRQGIIMIGLSAIFYLSILAIVALKKVLFTLDIIMSALVLGLSIVTYLGYMHPSRAKKK